MHADSCLDANTEEHAGSLTQEEGRSSYQQRDVMEVVVHKTGEEERRRGRRGGGHNLKIVLKGIRKCRKLQNHPPIQDTFFPPSSLRDASIQTICKMLIILIITWTR